jgi:hypothetical protein
MMIKRLRMAQICRRRGGNNQPATRPWRAAPTGPSGGCNALLLQRATVARYAARRFGGAGAGGLGSGLAAGGRASFASRRRPPRGQAGLASRGAYGPDREAFNSLGWTDPRGRGSSWTGQLGHRHLARTYEGP